MFANQISFTSDAPTGDIEFCVLDSKVTFLNKIELGL